MDDLLKSLAKFERRFFPRYKEHFRQLVDHGQHPRTLFIGCSDSRVVPYLLTGSGPGDLFVVRNVGNLIPPWGDDHAGHGAAAAIEYAVLVLGVRDIVVCGHSHCGAIRALYEGRHAGSPNLDLWLDFARDAMLSPPVSEELLCRTEQRSVVMQLERLMHYPMVRSRVEQGRLFLHGWHYLIEQGKVLILDVERQGFVPTDVVMDAQGAPGAAIYQLQ